MRKFGYIVIGLAVLSLISLLLEDQPEYTPEERPTESTAPDVAAAAPKPDRSLCTEKDQAAIRSTGFVKRIDGRSIDVDLKLWRDVEESTREGLAFWAANCLTEDGVVRIHDAKTGRGLADFDLVRGFRYR